MANDKTIELLNPAAALTGNEYIPIAQDGVVRRVQLSSILAFLNGGGTGTPASVLAKGSWSDAAKWDDTQAWKDS